MSITIINLTANPIVLRTPLGDITLPVSGTVAEVASIGAPQAAGAGAAAHPWRRRLQQRGRRGLPSGAACVGHMMDTPMPPGPPLLVIPTPVLGDGLPVPWWWPIEDTDWVPSQDGYMRLVTIGTGARYRLTAQGRAPAPMGTLPGSWRIEWVDGGGPQIEPQSGKSDQQQDPWDDAYAAFREVLQPFRTEQERADSKRRFTALLIQVAVAGGAKDPQTP